MLNFKNKKQLSYCVFFHLYKVLFQSCTHRQVLLIHVGRRRRHRTRHRSRLVGVRLESDDERAALGCEGKKETVSFFFLFLKKIKSRLKMQICIR